MEVPNFLNATLVLSIFGLFVFPALVMWLWNNTLPELLNMKHIRYWQAFRIYLLCAILFNGMDIVKWTQTTTVSGTDTQQTSQGETTTTKTTSDTLEFGLF